MGLDAHVWCDCVETGRLLTPHPFPALLFIDESDGPDIATEDIEQIDIHDAWQMASPCRHEFCTLLHHYLGNIARIEGFRQTLTQVSIDPENEFPILWNKVVYSGTHCGGCLNLEQVALLHDEVLQLRQCNFTTVDRERAALFSYFLGQLEELIAASEAVHKPICF